MWKMNRALLNGVLKDDQVFLSRQVVKHIWDTGISKENDKKKLNHVINLGNFG